MSLYLNTTTYHITQLGKERLLKLVEFIRNLDPVKWSFASWSRDAHGCGTIHCAGGWCPSIWPEEWEWRKSTAYGSGVPDLIPALKSDKHPIPLWSMSDFFGIHHDIAEMLFIPVDDGGDIDDASVEFCGIERPAANCTSQDWCDYAVRVIDTLAVVG